MTDCFILVVCFLQVHNVSCSTNIGFTSNSMTTEDDEDMKDCHNCFCRTKQQYSPVFFTSVVPFLLCIFTHIIDILRRINKRNLSPFFCLFCMFSIKSCLFNLLIWYENVQKITVVAFND